MQSAGNPNEQGSNAETEPAVGNTGNEGTRGSPTDNPETDPQPVTQSSNIQVSDLAEDEVQDAPKDWRQTASHWETQTHSNVEINSVKCTVVSLHVYSTK